jgi:hypothetical protein
MVQGNVVTATKSLWASLTWVAVSGLFGQFKQIVGGRNIFSRPFIGGDGAWGANFVAAGASLTVTAATKNAVANGTPNVDGSFEDTSNALGNGVISYTLWADSASGHCVAVQV